MAFRIIAAALTLAATLIAAPASTRQQTPGISLVTGKAITPQGTHTEVGSFPANLAVSPDGRYVVVTNTGFRQYLTVLSAQDGRVVSQVDVNGSRPGGKGKAGLYYGLAFTGGSDGTATLYASHGVEDRIAIYSLDRDGKLTDTGRSLATPSGRATPNCPAGIALNRDGTRLYAANNITDAGTGLRGSLSVVDTASGKVAGKVGLPGYPIGAAAITAGTDADRKVYVSCERDGLVAVVDPTGLRTVRTIRVGAQPLALLLDRVQARLFVANTGSDTVSVVDTRSDRVVATIPLRPAAARGLPGATPTGLALSPDEGTLYVSLADMNAVAVVRLPEAALAGYVPTGWYPTAVAVSRDGARLFVASAKGANERNPNSKPTGPNGAWGTYIPNVIEGTVSTIAVPGANDLERLTAQTLANNMLATAGRRPAGFRNPGIEHVIYVVKENRTYDQVLGDLPRGDGDASICMFPREVTPNQHALAERFVLLDNFYVCAEVSEDGWAWSNSGMVSAYGQRNTFYSYGGRGRSYDTEGENSGIPVDLLGVPDVARAPSGYIWDLAAKKGIPFRNYGFFVTGDKGEMKTSRGTVRWTGNAASQRALVGRTDEDFLQFHMGYADSDAWVIHGAPSPNQMKEFGAHKAPSRFAEWKREFDGFVRNGDLPRFMMVRLPRDHTAGTTPGLHSPRAMAADNDFAVGQLVEAVSHSPYWMKTAIFIIEDDAQNGTDHVDGHRSTCYVVSPYIRKGTVDHSFYNTDSVLRTMELLLGLPPMCQYDAVAPPFGFLGRQAANAEPYTAILPARRIVGETNAATAYRAHDSLALDFSRADAVPDDVLTDIVWHAVMGDRPMPAARHGLRARAATNDE